MQFYAGVFYVTVPRLGKLMSEKVIYQPSAIMRRQLRELQRGPVCGAGHTAIICQPTQANHEIKTLLPSFFHTTNQTMANIISSALAHFLSGIRLLNAILG